MPGVSLLRRVPKPRPQLARRYLPHVPAEIDATKCNSCGKGLVYAHTGKIRCAKDKFGISVRFCGKCSKEMDDAAYRNSPEGLQEQGLAETRKAIKKFS